MGKKKNQEQLDELIRCDQCRCWMYVEETDFATIDEAHRSQDPFTCKICVKFDNMAETINVLKANVDRTDNEKKALEGKIEKLTEQESKQRGVIETLTTKVSDIEEEIASLRAAMQTTETMICDTLAAYLAGAQTGPEIPHENGGQQATYAQVTGSGSRDLVTSERRRARDPTQRIPKKRSPR